MALIFCEGFNDFRTINANYYLQLDEWTANGVIGFDSPRSGAYALRLYQQTTTQTKLQLDLAAFGGPHTGKKLYVGFAVNNLSSFAAAPGTTSPRRLVTFLNAASDEVLQVDVKKETTASDLNMKFAVSQAGTQFAEYTLTGLFPSTENPTGGSGVQQQVFRTYRYIEFEIDLVGKTFALRVEGASKNVTGTNSNLSNFPVTINNISTFQFHGVRGFDTYIDDFYVADSLAASGLQATLSVGSNIVTLKNGGSTLNLAVGQTISLAAGSAGAFGTPAAPDTLAISSISDSTRFVVNANHATSGDVTFNVIDPVGTALNTWYGPCRVLTPALNAPTFLDSVADVWSTSSNTKLENNDGDGTNAYVASGTIGKKQLISLAQSSFETGAITIGEEEYIAAVQLNTVIRKTNQDTAIKSIYKSATGAYHDVGAGVNITDDNYKTRLFFLPKNPATNAAWELNAIVDASSSNAVNNGFGVEIVAVPTT